MGKQRFLATLALGLGVGLAGLLACSGEGGGAGQGGAAPDGSKGADGGDRPADTGRGADAEAGRDASAEAGTTPSLPTASPSAFALGFDASCVVRDAKLRCWGSSVYGVFGPGAPTGTRIPPWTVAGIAPTAAVVAEDHACALADGGTYCWGANLASQLGPVTPPCETSTCATPAPLTGVPGVAQVVGHYNATCARVASGTVTCWGGNEQGSAGRDGGASSVPSTVPLTNVVDVGMGYQFACALRQDGTVWCWGSNERGTLGRSTNAGSASGTDTEAHPVPTPVTDLSGVVQLAVGTHHACALLSDGKVTCWGWNGDPGRGGQLGHDPKGDARCGDIGFCRTSPTEVAGVGAVVKIAAGAWHTCVLRTDKTVACWGWSFRGALGHDPSEDSATEGIAPTPRVVAGLADVTDLALGGAHACALTSGNKVLCWGNNNEGQLGHADAGPALGSWMPIEPVGL